MKCACKIFDSCLFSPTLPKASCTWFLNYNITIATGFKFWTASSPLNTLITATFLAHMAMSVDFTHGTDHPHASNLHGLKA